MSIIEIGDNEYLDTEGLTTSALSDEPVIFSFHLGDKMVDVTYSMLDNNLKKKYDDGSLLRHMARWDGKFIDSCSIDEN